jgi:hypothetical protein
MHLIIDNEFIVNLLLFTVLIPYIQLTILLTIFFVSNLPNNLINIIRKIKDILDYILDYVINVYDELDKSGF